MKPFFDMPSFPCCESTPGTSRVYQLGTSKKPRSPQRIDLWSEDTRVAAWSSTVTISPILWFFPPLILSQRQAPSPPIKKSTRPLPTLYSKVEFPADLQQPNPRTMTLPVFLNPYPQMFWTPKVENLREPPNVEPNKGVSIKEAFFSTKKSRFNLDNFFPNPSPLVWVKVVRPRN
jgi:hypothetical protein